MYARTVSIKPHKERGKAMFFIAAFNPKLNQIGSIAGKCPVCGVQDKLFLVRQRQVLSVFFIPVFHFGGGYIATCGKCASVMEISKDAGKAAEKDSDFIIQDHQIKIIKNNVGSRCPSCGRHIYSDQSFCPGCGIKLE